MSVSHVVTLGFGSFSSGGGYAHASEIPNCVPANVRDGVTIDDVTGTLMWGGGEIIGESDEDWTTEILGSSWYGIGEAENG